MFVEPALRQLARNPSASQEYVAHVSSRFPDASIRDLAQRRLARVRGELIDEEDNAVKMREYQILDPTLLSFNAAKIDSLGVQPTEDVFLDIVSREKGFVSRVSFEQGSFDECVDWLVFRATTSVFRDEVFWFLYGYRSFASPEQLLKQMERVAINITNTASLAPFWRRFWEVMWFWLHLRGHNDFPDLDQLTAFLARIKGSPQPPFLAGALKSASSGRHGSLSPRKRWSLMDDQVLMKDVKSPIETKLRSSWSAKQIAEQMTLIVYALFASIEPEEFVDNAWQNDDCERTAPYLTKLSGRSSQISSWVALQVLKAADGQERVSEVVRFINVMDELLKLKNFDCVTSVLAGLKHVAVARIIDWEPIPAETRQIFVRVEKMMDPVQNFRGYREEMSNAEQVRVVGGEPVPLLPFISLHLRDVLFLGIGSPRKEAPAVVHYEKILSFGAFVAKVCFHQRKPYEIAAVPELYQFLWHAKGPSDDELMRLSSELRPRTAPRGGDVVPLPPVHLAAVASSTHTTSIPSGNLLAPPAGGARGSSSSSSAPSSTTPSPASSAPKLSPRIRIFKSLADPDSLQEPVVVKNPLFGKKVSTSAKDSKFRMSGIMRRVGGQGGTGTEDSGDDTPGSSEEGPPLQAAVTPLLSGGHVKGWQGMEGIPQSEQECSDFLRNYEADLKMLTNMCTSRRLMLSPQAVSMFFTSYRCSTKAAMRQIISYWQLQESMHFRTLTVEDVAPTLWSHILCAPFTSDSFDSEGRPVIVMRANLWWDGELTQPTPDELKMALMWICESLALHVPTRFTGFTFVLDMQRWTRKNFTLNLYTQIFSLLQFGLPVRCERFLFLDVPKSFGEYWVNLSKALSADFKQRMVITTRDDVIKRFIPRAALPLDLGGLLNLSSLGLLIYQAKRFELGNSMSRPLSVVAPSRPEDQPNLALTADLEESPNLSRPEVYQRKLSRASSTNNSPRSRSNSNPKRPANSDSPSRSTTGSPARSVETSPRHL